MEYSTLVFIMLYQNIVTLGVLSIVALFTKFKILKSTISVKIFWVVLTIWTFIILTESLYISYSLPGG